MVSENASPAINTTKATTLSQRKLGAFHCHTSVPATTTTGSTQALAMQTNINAGALGWLQKDSLEKLQNAHIGIFTAK